MRRIAKLSKSPRSEHSDGPTGRRTDREGRARSFRLEILIKNINTI